MFSKLIDKIKLRNRKMALVARCNEDVQKDEELPLEMKISVAYDNDVYKIEIDDYMSISEYFEQMAIADTWGVNEHIGNSVLWNSRKQKINKGIIYVVLVDNRTYNFLLKDDEVIVDERINVDGDITERVVSYYSECDDYDFVKYKHDKTGDTYYTMYYSKNGFSLKTLEFSKEEAFREIAGEISRVDDISGIRSIIDVDSLRQVILSDLVPSSSDNELKKTL